MKWISREAENVVKLTEEAEILFLHLGLLKRSLFVCLSLFKNKSDIRLDVTRRVLGKPF